LLPLSFSVGNQANKGTAAGARLALSRATSFQGEPMRMDWIRTHKRVFFLPLLLPLLTAENCPPQVKKPPSDTNAPLLEWVVNNRSTNASQTYVGDATIQAKWGDRYYVTLRSYNPGGVHQITLDGEASWQCVSGNLGQNKDALYAPISSTLNPDANDMVDTYAVLFTQADLSLDCPGFQFSSGGVGYQGTATNYYGVSGQATLSFNVTP
jgi:hypothetical protein